MNTDVITLVDPASGTRARIDPRRGFNCFSFEAVLAGRSCELLWAAADFVSGAGKPSRSGIPLLFPFAGRIRGTSFEFDGRRYALAVGDDFGNAIHGFVLTRPWRVGRQSESLVTGEFQASVDDPSLLPHWPADFRIAVRYAVAAGRLRMEVEVSNPDTRSLPFWFGTHPYFRLPLLPGSLADDCRITVPATGYWQLADMLPTGRVLAVDGPRDLTGGRSFRGLKLDDILGQLQSAGGATLATIHDPAGHELRVSFGRQFPACVVFTPPHREAICIEPYTSVSNAFELEQAGHATGLTVLQPGQAWNAWIEISVS